VLEEAAAAEQAPRLPLLRARVRAPDGRLQAPRGLHGGKADGEGAVKPEERAKALAAEIERAQFTYLCGYTDGTFSVRPEGEELLAAVIRNAVADELRHQAGDGLRGLFPSYVSAICMGETVSLNEVAEWLNGRADELTQDASPSCAPGAGGAEAKATAEPSNPETCGRHRS
jgi:hypothetical protein